MCGIFGYLSLNPEKIGLDLDSNQSLIYDEFIKTSFRGPNKSTFMTTNIKDDYLALGFHRLSIIGLESGDQPFQSDGVYLTVNGEIYNHQQLIKDHNLKLKTDSDCEVILHLYKKYGMKKTIELIDGVWAFILYDCEIDKMYFARDMYGVRPLFYGNSTNIRNNDSLFSKNHCGNNVDIVVGSQLSNVNAWNNCKPVLPRMLYTVEKDEFGYFSTSMEEYIDISYKGIETEQLLDTMGYSHSLQAIYDDDSEIASLFKEAVIKRLNSEQPVGFLLSGGLDSSLVLAVAMDYIYSRSIEYQPEYINVFTIGSKGSSPDVDASIELVAWLNNKYGNHIKHHIVNFTESDWCGDCTYDVIKCLESWDTTTVRASVPMYLISKYISEKTDVKVILSGEGSDELFGGYLYFHNAPNNKEFEKESRRLLTDLYLYDVLRADRTTARCGLEVRVPFLDKEFSTYIMSLHTSLKLPKYNKVCDKKIEKHLLRSHHVGMLPDNILWRVKNGMSDGVGTLYQKWVQNKASTVINEQHSPSGLETAYYKKLFCIDYEKYEDIIPYVWLPKWSPTTNDDPSGLLLM